MFRSTYRELRFAGERFAALRFAGALARADFALADFRVVERVFFLVGDAMC